MHIKICLKKLISISVAAVMAATLVGCFNLGGYKDENDYYDTYGSVRLVYQNTESLEKDIKYTDYSVKDYFYNKNTGNDFTYGNPKDSEADDGKDIPQAAYLYMAIPVKKDMTLESFALYFNATQSGSLRINFYLVNELPDEGDFTNVRLLNDPEYKQEDDEVSDEEELDPIIYSDPDESFKVAEATVNVFAREWNSVLVETWRTNGTSLSVAKSQYLLLRFMNNGAEKAEEDIPIAFRTTNLLIRAFF